MIFTKTTRQTLLRGVALFKPRPAAHAAQDPHQ